MIPKKIHYIWLGNNKPNGLCLSCINSCKRVLSDYEIIVWSEKSLELNRLTKNNRFLKKCIECGLWAFASDYLRLYILYNEGGIYLDTDVEVLKTFDGMLGYTCFIGLEQGEYIGTGIIGAEKHSTSIKRLLDFYEEEIWNVDYYNNPIIFKKLFEEEPDRFKEVVIFPVDYFAPYNPFGENSDIIGTSNTVCIHWYNANWGMSRKGYVFLNTKHFKNPVIKAFQIIKKSIGYYRKRRMVKK